MVSPRNMNKLTELCPDFEEWPKRWMGDDEDLAYGIKLLEVFRPFCEHLVALDESIRSKKNDLDNIWLLGGEIIRDVSIHEEYETPPIKKLQESVGIHGGVSCRHMKTTAEEESYNKTCVKLAEFIWAS